MNSKNSAQTINREFHKQVILKIRRKEKIKKFAGIEFDSI